MKKYVYYNNNYYTTDGWNSFEKQKNPGSDFISESNGDIIVKLKLIDHFGYEQGEELVKTFEILEKILTMCIKRRIKAQLLAMDMDIVFRF